MVIFVAVIIVVIGGPLFLIARSGRAKPGQMEMVLLASSAGKAELELWEAALAHHGIRWHVVNLAGEITRYSSSDAFEIWVPAKDEERARQALGFDR